jgi:glycosyltransferase involved in cell wall biosynthesis
VEAVWDDMGLGAVPGPRVLHLPRAVLYDTWHLLGWPSACSGADVDVVHAPSLAVPPKSGRPLVVSVHDAAPWLFPEAFSARGRWFHAMGARAARRRADRVITGTQAAAAELADYMALPEERVRVVPYGVDHPPPCTGTRSREELLRRHGLTGAPYVLWVGSLEPRKGVGTLVAAMARLARGTSGGGPPAALVLAGYAGWQNSALITPEDAAALGPAFHQLGRLAERDLQAVYAGATVFAFPSVHEGFGLPVLEAMAAGVPVVASDIPAVREVAGGAAVLVPPGDVVAWAEALEAVLISGPRRAELVGLGAQRAAQLSWGRTAAATIEVYKELTG